MPIGSRLVTRILRSAQLFRDRLIHDAVLSNLVEREDIVIQSDVCCLDVQRGQHLREIWPPLHDRVAAPRATVDRFHSRRGQRRSLFFFLIIRPPPRSPLFPPAPLSR